MVDSSYHTINLTIKEIHGPSIGDVIFESIKEVLNEYDLNIKQILSLTSDNGANMIKYSELLRTQISTIETSGILSTPYLNYYDRDQEDLNDLKIIYFLIKSY